MKNTMQLSPENSGPTDFRYFLGIELARRCQANPKYSLRAFARFLKVSPAFLSKLLRGQRSITTRTFTGFTQKLALSPREVERFHDQVGKKVEAAPSDFHQLSADLFEVIADWYHYAILELLTVKAFEVDSKQISKALGITVIEAGLALDRLERVSMIRKSKSGRWRNASGNNTNIGADLNHAALRRHQKQVLEKALLALDEIPVEQRDQSSLTLALDSKYLPQIQARIQTFRRELAAFHVKSAKRNRVYQLSVSLFPITEDLSTQTTDNQTTEK